MESRNINYIYIFIIIIENITVSLKKWPSAVTCIAFIYGKSTTIYIIS